MLVQIVVVTVGVALALLTAAGGFAGKWARRSDQVLVAPEGAEFGVASRLIRAGADLVPAISSAKEWSARFPASEDYDAAA